MTQATILPSAVPIEVIHAADWDRSPIRELLVTCLHSRPVVSGDLESVYEAERAGIVDLRETRLELRGHPHLVVATHLGVDLALKLAHSDELCCLADESLAQPQDWAGVDPRRIFSELDLRAGGHGNVPDCRAWARARLRAQVVQLPRRGLDVTSAHHHRG